jgi:hypothetical protein
MDVFDFVLSVLAGRAAVHIHPMLTALRTCADSEKIFPRDLGAHEKGTVTRR